MHVVGSSKVREVDHANFFFFLFFYACTGWTLPAGRCGSVTCFVPLPKPEGRARRWKKKKSTRPESAVRSLSSFCSCVTDVTSSPSEGVLWLQRRRPPLRRSALPPALLLAASTWAQGAAACFNTGRLKKRKEKEKTPHSLSQISSCCGRSAQLYGCEFNNLQLSFEQRRIPGFLGPFYQVETAPHQCTPNK